MTLHPALIAHLFAQDVGLPLATCDALAAIELDHSPQCFPEAVAPAPADDWSATHATEQVQP